MRIGHGYDVHQLVTGRDLIIGGVHIDYDKGLLGHSDADVLVHAIMDSIIGALGLGDIGRHFPDTDPRFKGADSMALLEHVEMLMDEAGYKIGNIDSTIIAQKPKMAPHLENMIKGISKVLRCQSNQINIKATTEEKMGFTGSGHGISAHSVCLLVSK